MAGVVAAAGAGRLPDAHAGHAADDAGRPALRRRGRRGRRVPGASGWRRPSRRASTSERICVDPGIGFGKTVEHNLRLLQRAGCAVRARPPVVVGVSRKRFLGALTGGGRASGCRGDRGRQRRGVRARRADLPRPRRARPTATRWPSPRRSRRRRERPGGRDRRPRGVRPPRRACARAARRPDLPVRHPAGVARAGAERTDDLADAVDYGAVANRVVELARGGPYDLLERLAAVIADDLVAALPGGRRDGDRAQAAGADPASVRRRHRDGQASVIGRLGIRQRSRGFPTRLGGCTTELWASRASSSWRIIRCFCAGSSAARGRAACPSWQPHAGCTTG